MANVYDNVIVYISVLYSYSLFLIITTVIVGCAECGHVSTVQVHRPDRTFSRLPAKSRLTAPRKKSTSEHPPRKIDRNRMHRITSEAHAQKQLDRRTCNNTANISSSSLEHIYYSSVFVALILSSKEVHPLCKTGNMPN